MQDRRSYIPPCFSLFPVCVSYLPVILTLRPLSSGCLTYFRRCVASVCRPDSIQHTNACSCLFTKVSDRSLIRLLPQEPHLGHFRRFNYTTTKHQHVFATTDPRARRQCPHDDRPNNNLRLVACTRRVLFSGGQTHSRSTIGTRLPSTTSMRPHTSTNASRPNTATSPQPRRHTRACRNRPRRPGKQTRLVSHNIH